MKYHLCLLPISLLAGCSTCELPAIHQWTVAEQEQIAKERNDMAHNSPDDILLGVLTEWETTRQELK